MNDIASRVPEESLGEWAHTATSLFQERRALLIKVNRVSLAANVALVVTVLMLGAAIAVMIPLQRLLPLVLTINADNSYERIRDLSELSASKQEDVVKSVLWSYVLNRESYIFEGAKRRYDIVTALSAGKAQQEYQSWFKNDYSSPQYRIRDRGHVDVKEVTNSAELRDRLDTCRGADWCEASLSYWRTEQMYGQAPTKEKHYTSTLAFIVVDALDPGERTTINPAGIKIISYRTDCDDCAN